MRLHKNRLPDQGIIYKGAILECWLPSHAQSMLRYNKNHLPVVQLRVEYHPVHQCIIIFDREKVVYAEFKHKYRYE